MQVPNIVEASDLTTDKEYFLVRLCLLVTTVV